MEGPKFSFSLIGWVLGSLIFIGFLGALYLYEPVPEQDGLKSTIEKSFKFERDFKTKK